MAVAMRETSLIDQRWIETGGNNPLGIARNFQELFNCIPRNRKLVQIYSKRPTYLVCIDERLVGSAALRQINHIHMAGEGILNTDADKDLMDFVRGRARINGIIPHLDCAAKEQYAERLEITGNAEAVGMFAVQELAARLRVPITRIIHTNEFRTSVHDARAIYYDGVGGFDWSRVSGLPPGFIITRRWIYDPSQAQKEAKIALDVALQKGFGKRLEKSVVYLVAVTDERDPEAVKMPTLFGELRELANQSTIAVADSILVR